MALDNIPRVDVTINDGGLRLSEPVAGPKVTLLGVTTGTNLTIGEPFLVPDVETGFLYSAEASGRPSELTKALEEAYAGGAKAIELVKIADTSNEAVSLDERYAALQSAYDTLKNTDVDVAVPVGAYIDKPAASGDFAYQLAMFCYESTATNRACIGVIDHRNALQIAEEEDGASVDTDQGTPTLAQVERWTQALESFEFCSDFDGVTDADSDYRPENYKYWATTDGVPAVEGAASVITDARGNPVDAGAYISVTAFNARYFNSSGQLLSPTTSYYNGGGAALYAGMITSLVAHSAPTNKPVPNLVQQRNASLSQVDRIIGARFVTTGLKPKGVVIMRGITGAYNISQYARSDFVNLTTVRITHEAVRVIRQVADPFLGEPNTATKRSALDQAIDAALGKMQEKGALRRYQYSITATTSQQILGEASVKLTLVPAFELVRINTVVSLAPE